MSFLMLLQIPLKFWHLCKNFPAKISGTPKFFIRRVNNTGGRWNCLWWLTLRLTGRQAWCAVLNPLTEHHWHHPHPQHILSWNLKRYCCCFTVSCIYSIVVVATDAEQQWGRDQLAGVPAAEWPGAECRNIADQSCKWTFAKFEALRHHANQYTHPFWSLGSHFMSSGLMPI